jgi:hypothetical protein
VPLQFCDPSPGKIVAAAIVCAITGPGTIHSGGALDQIPPLNVVEIRDPDGQILSYRHLAGSTEVTMRGTNVAPQARVSLKVGSRPGFVELDINRGNVTGLKPAHTLGRDFLTYVLWAVSVDGRASNLGEITFENDRAIAVNVTTPYQTFWLMVTAEPNYAVVDPSPVVVLYSVKQAASAENKAVTISTQLFYFTHYVKYNRQDANPSLGIPNQLLQARKAVELARNSALVPPSRSDRQGLQEEEFTRRALSEAQAFLTRAEQTYKQNPLSRDVVQYARTAAQSAENARALAMGAVGGLVIRQLQDELDRLRAEVRRLDPNSPLLPGGTAGTGTNGLALPGGAPVATAAPLPVINVPLAQQPAIWFAVAGWLLAIVVLFRRRPG